MKWLSLLFTLLFLLHHTILTADETVGRFAPTKGQVLVFAGGDNSSVGGTANHRDGYVDNIGTPSGVAHTIRISGEDPDTIQGLRETSVWGSGPMDLQAYLDFPTLDRCVVHLSISMVDGADERIANGSYDPIVKELVKFIGAHPGHPFLIQIGPEFDGFSPEIFQRAFRRIVDLFRREKTANVAFVLGSSHNASTGDFERYDPGTDYYDWIAYNWWEEGDGSAALNFAYKLGKPAIISKATPKGRDFPNESGEEIWKEWFEPFFAHIEKNESLVRGVTYLNTDFDSLDAFRDWGFTRIETATEVLQKWREKMNLPRYLNSVDKPFDHIGFPAAFLPPQKRSGDLRNAPYKNPSLTIDERVKDLISRMSLEEKAAQLMSWGDFDERKLRSEGKIYSQKFYESVAPHGIGMIAPAYLNTEEDIRQHYAIQSYFLEQTRLGIPALRYREGGHGLSAFEATSFPAPIALSCSWNPKLIEQIYTHVAQEASSRGIDQLLGPNLNLVRDQRWGQIDETLGEDPFLTGRLGRAMVRGLQGADDGQVRSGHVAATLKHFAGYGGSKAGEKFSPYLGSARQLLDFEVEAFRSVHDYTFPAVVIPTHTPFEETPSHANPWLLKDILRKDIDFQGLVMSDNWALEALKDPLAIATKPEEAAHLAIQSGIQIEIPSSYGFSHLPALVDSGKVKISTLNEAVRAVLRLKFRLGLFEKRYLDLRLAEQLNSSEESSNLALEAARQSIVLLKNSNDTLPLDKTKIKTLAVIGPNSDVCRLGNRSGSPRKTISILDGLKQKLGDTVNILHAKGCFFALNDTNDSYQNWKYVNIVNEVSLEQNLPMIEEAVGIANRADAVLLALGENEFLAREPRGISENRTSLKLTPSQMELAKRVFETGKPVILYLSHAKPFTLAELTHQMDAILTGHYTGQETGTAVAEVLFGETNPAGKLTLSWPESPRDQPIYYNQPPNRKGIVKEPAYPFGYGLSYTRFQYSKPQLSKPSIKPGETVDVTFNLKNMGQVKGAEIAQLYIKGKNFPVERPSLELKGFQRVELNPGEEKMVTITIDADDLHFRLENLKRSLPDGEFLVSIGSSSKELSEPITLKASSGPAPLKRQASPDPEPLPILTEVKEPIPLEKTTPDRPNILFISVDDLRPELGVYQSKVITPRMDKLAQGGALFNRAYCQQAASGASRLSLMTSLYPTLTGENTDHIEDWRERLPEVVTLNQYFQKNGYQTIGLGKVYHDTTGQSIDPENWDQWFNLSSPDYLLTENLAALEEAIELWEESDQVDPPKGPMTEAADVPDAGYVDGKRAKRAEEILADLASAESERPFFFALGFSKPHLPFTAPKKYWDLYERDSFQMPTNRGTPSGYPIFATNPTAEEMSQHSDYIGRTPKDFPDILNRRLLHGYAASVSYVDACIGQTLDALESHGLADNTIVVLWGDHGWKLGDHSTWSKHTNFECDTRVPLIIRDPRPKAVRGQQIDRIVELVDLYPTLCDLAGIETPDFCQGRSFQKVLEDPTAGHRWDAYSSHPTPQGGMSHSIRFKEYRYTRWFNQTGEATHEVLTHLESDPGEVTNLINNSTQREIVAEVRKRLAIRMAEAELAPEKYRGLLNPSLNNPEKKPTEFPPVDVTIDLSEENLRQTIDGFGGSIAFWGLNADNKALETGIHGLNVQFIRAQGEVPPSGQPDRNRDVLQRAMEINPRLEIMLSFWQPRSKEKSATDYWLDEVDFDGDIQYQLKTEREDEWADEIVARTQQYLDWGINVTTLGVQNESNISQPRTQTCTWDPDRLAIFIEDKLTPRLAAAGFSGMKIAAPDLAFIGKRASEIDRFIPTLTSPAVDISSYHMYDTFNDEMENKSLLSLQRDNATMARIKRQYFPEKKLWMTETTGAQYNNTHWHTYGWTPGMTEHEKAIQAARYLHTTFVDAEANAFFWWGLIYSLAPKDETRPEVIQQHRDEGLVLVKETVGENGQQAFLEKTRKFYAFRQFSGFVKPGYRRVAVETPDHLPLAAFVDKDKKLVVAVAINDTDLPQTLSIAAPPEMRLIGTVQTDEFRNCSPVEAASKLPPKSIRTLVFSK